jgi:hypothetical protein
MRKLLLVLGILIVALASVTLLAWVYRANVAAHILAQELSVPVHINLLEIQKGEASLRRLWIGNPKQSKTQPAFTAESIVVTATLDQIMGNPLVIEEIVFEDIFVGVELYSKNGTDNNWAHILQEHKKLERKSRDYLIKTLRFKNLMVELTLSNGTVKRYPVPDMEFHNISSDTGFPIEDIQKAIFELMMKDIFRKLQLDKLIETIDPLQILPNGFRNLFN